MHASVRYLDTYWLLMGVSLMNMVFEKLEEKPSEPYYQLHPKHKFINQSGCITDGAMRYGTITPMDWVVESVNKRAWMFVDPFSKREGTGSAHIVLMPIDCPWTKEV